MTLSGMLRGLLVQLAYAIGAGVILVMADSLMSFAAAPVGGGEYHLIFAYSDEGRLSLALHTYAVHIGSLAAAASALVALGYPLRWPAVVAAASALGLSSWWGIVSWQPQSATFHNVVLLLLPFIPVFIALAVVPVAWRRGVLRSELHAPREGGSAEPRRLGRFARGLAWLVLAMPLLTLARLELRPRLADVDRVRWQAPQWESVSPDTTDPPLLRETGVVFDSGRGRSLLGQCARETPGWVVGYWDPSPEQISRLETDLASFLVRNDTGRTRADGFRMPPLDIYYRQYGGITLLGGKRLIYVNGILRGDSSEFGEIHSEWKSEVINVCGGWQAYFGVEYDPATRRFRGFSYNTWDYLKRE